MFGNLRLGPQLMKDIKKMLTHPMRNPYDKTSMKSNLIVMQDYKPPAGQLFPNSALIAGPDRPPNNIYVPAKQIQQNFQSYSPNDIAFAASTPDTRYIPAGFTNRPLNADAEVFQRQRQSAQYVQGSNIQTTQHSEIGNLVANRHAPQYTQNRNNEQINGPRPRQNQNFNQANAQYTQNQRITSLPTQQGNIQTIQGDQLNRQRTQYTDLKKLSQTNGGKPNQIVSYTKEQFTQEKQPYTYRQPILPQEPNGNGNYEVKQNLVSADVPSTVITKTLTYSKVIQEPNPGRPKSRVTVKTWIVKPKSARLIAEPTSYYYDKPTQPPKLVMAKTSPYTYNRPAKPLQLERVVQENNLRPYVYDRPTIPPKSERVVEDEPQPYTYNRPSPAPLPSTQSEIIENDDAPQPYVYSRATVASKQVLTTRSNPSRAYVPPTSAPTRSRVTQGAQLNLSPSTTPPTQSSKLYLVPTTFNPAARLYLPPNPQVLERQYLPPPTYYQSSQLRVAPTVPSTTMTTSTEIPKNPSYSVVKQSRTNVSRNNLTFTDILTKEKLDITVNDIVKDTGKILQTASPPQFAQYREDIKAVDYPDDNYLPAEQDDSDEKLTSQTPTATTASKSSRLITQPARSLEPPAETANNNQNSNILSNLPFYKDPSIPNTIERTVSLKITIPERVASYLFKGGNETDFDSLEILNTGSSNYLVLSNHLLNKNSGGSIPIDAVLKSKNSNISNSQALVFSFLADSLNAAKEYGNLVKQDVLSSTPTPAPRYQNLNNEDLSQITNQISQLTSSHFSNNNNNVNANIIETTSRPTTPTQTNLVNSNTQFVSQPNQAQKTGNAQYNITPSLQTQRQLLSQYQTDNNILSANLLDSNQNQIYSGQLYQLPVPEVTNYIYNRPQLGNLVRTNHEQNTKMVSSPQNTDQNNNVAARNNLPNQFSTEVEIVRSQTSTLNPAKLQLEHINEPESFYSQESLNSLLNSDNGISAQLQDKIVGVIPHPLEDNKLLTYEKDQSYYLFTKFDKNAQNVPLNAVNKVANIPSVITFQFVPSVSYQLEDEKDQQKLLNTFNIDEFGAPRGVTKANLVQISDQQRGTLTSNVDYSVDHPASAKQLRLDPISALYKGPSSYSAPQGSIGSLSRQILLPNLRSRLEQLNENTEGYPKAAPARRFVF